MLMIMSNNMLDKIEQAVSKIEIEYRFKIAKVVNKNDLLNLTGLVNQVSVIICEETVLENLGLFEFFKKGFENCNIIVICHSKHSCDQLSQKGFENYIYLKPQINLETEIKNLIRAPKKQKVHQAIKAQQIVLVISLDKYCGTTNLLKNIINEKYLTLFQAYQIDNQRIIQKDNLKQVVNFKSDKMLVVDYGGINTCELKWLFKHSHLFTKIIINNTSNLKYYNSCEYQELLKLIEQNLNRKLILEPNVAKSSIVKTLIKRKNKKAVINYVKDCKPCILAHAIKTK